LTTKLESFGSKQELLRNTRKAGNPELHPLHPLLCLEHQQVLDLHKGFEIELDQTLNIKVVMENPWSQMGPGKSDEHPS
ncbi:hypothetical protein Taro_017740, partial [Colocasia esculenta]|nr:hypothetical protein [Colocasia esculenta]